MEADFDYEQYLRECQAVDETLDSIPAEEPHYSDNTKNVTEEF